MKNDDYFTEDYDEIIAKQHLRHRVISDVILVILLIGLSLIYLAKDYAVSSTSEFHPYELRAEITDVYRVNDSYFITVRGQHDGSTEEHNIEITQDQFMKYKKGQFLTIRVNDRHCYIVGTS